MPRRRHAAVHRTGKKRPVARPPGTEAGRSRSKSAPQPESSSASASQSSPAGSALPVWFAKILEIAQRRAAARVEALRVQFPEAPPRELGERLVQSSALRAGLLGAATGTLALITL